MWTSRPVMLCQCYVKCSARLHLQRHTHTTVLFCISSADEHLNKSAGKKRLTGNRDADD